jgi:2-iminobutanoate/2-iminopropanoate deaminase
MKIIKTDKAPIAIGPYSQAIKAGKFLFVSGQIPINHKTNELVANNIEIQAETVINNVFSIVKAADYKIENIVKVTIYIKDMNDFNIINNVYEKFFCDHRPARVVVEVSRLPKNVLIEMDAICYSE